MSYLDTYHNLPLFLYGLSVNYVLKIDRILTCCGIYTLRTVCSRVCFIEPYRSLYNNPKNRILLVSRPASTPSSAVSCFERYGVSRHPYYISRLTASKHQFGSQHYYTGCLTTNCGDLNMENYS